jgi:hypothetical protein
LLGISGGSDNGGLTPAIATIRRYEDRRLPKAPVGIAGAVVEAIGDVIDAVVAKVTKTQSAMNWLADRPKDGPVEQKAIEIDGWPGSG